MRQILFDFFFPTLFFGAMILCAALAMSWFLPPVRTVTISAPTSVISEIVGSQPTGTLSLVQLDASCFLFHTHEDGKTETLSFRYGTLEVICNPTDMTSTALMTARGFLPGK